MYTQTHTQLGSIPVTVPQREVLTGRCGLLSRMFLSRAVDFATFSSVIRKLIVLQLSPYREHSEKVTARRWHILDHVVGVRRGAAGEEPAE